MRSFLKSIQDHKKIIIGIILAPLTMYVFSILVTSVFNMGTYVGTFFRNLYSLVC